MKKIIVLIIGLLALSVYAGDSFSPSKVTETFDFNNWAFGSDVESIEEGNVESFIEGDRTAVAIYNVMGRYFHRETSSIRGDNEYGLYTESNSLGVLSLLSIENYGDISSEHGVGLNQVGINGILNNYSTGHIYGAQIGIQIDPEAGTSIYNGFEINNYGQIESAGLGIYQLSNKQNLTIYNSGYIDAVNYGVLMWGKADIINDGEINSFYSSGLYLLDGGIIENNGLINAGNDDAVRSRNILTLKGDGEYKGGITYVGNADESLTAKSYLILDNINTDFKNGRLKDWHSITVIGGENYFNVEFHNFQDYNNSRSNVYLTGGGILHTGDGDNGMMNLHIANGIVNPYENNYDTNGNYFWNRFAQEREGGGQYYDVRDYEKLTVNDLIIENNGGLVIDIKDAKPLYPNDYVYIDDDFYHDKHTHPDGKYAGWGHAAFKGKPIPVYHRINHDSVDVKGTSHIAPEATLYLVDHTLESYDNESFFATFTQMFIDVFDGNIRFDDFTDIKFYSDIYGIESLDNETGVAHLSIAAYIDDQPGVIAWWLKETSLGFQDIPPLSSEYDDATMSTMSMVTTTETLEPYQVSRAYSANITELNRTEALQQTIYGFQSWDDLDAFMDSINKVEYASLATSNLNLISNRVNQMFDRLSAGHMRDNNGLNIWADLYFSDDSLDGTGNHGIDGHGTEFAAGLDKMFNDTTFGLSATYTDYTSTVNDDGVHTDIKSEGLGLNLYMMMDQGNLRHKAMLGYTSYNNTGDDVQDFDSSEMFASYRTELTIKTDSLEIKPFAGLRYSMVQFDEIREDAENGLKSFDQDSLESELGVKLVKQFKRLGVSVSGAWMHEFLDSQTTAEAFTSFGNFSQDGIARDADSFRATIGFEYQLTDKVTLDFDYAKELSDNSESDSVNGKITFRF